MNTAFLNAKNDFLAAAKRTYESGIQTGTGGNLSVRIPGENLMIVKPSGFSYGQCTE
ncbi:MAG: class II aldolase/adducin family protein, partial [Clostridium sp.]